jgi:hypothetical protein
VVVQLIKGGMEAKSPFRGLAFGAVASCLAEIGESLERKRRGGSARTQEKRRAVSIERTEQRR